VSGEWEQNREVKAMRYIGDRGQGSAFRIPHSAFRIGKRGQSIAEYAVLLGLVVTALVTIQVYARRGIQARVRSGTDALTNIAATISSTGDASLTTNFVSRSQYEPYYTEASNETYQEQVTQEHLGSGEIKREVVSDVTARAAGGFQAQTDVTNRGTKDAMWGTN
jgi:hypothetical protein